MSRTQDPLQDALDQITVAPRMSRMADVFGVADALPQAEAWRARDMTDRCVACRHTGACAALLAADNASDARAGFCPNVTHFRALAARRDGSSNLVAAAGPDCLTWPDRETGWDRRCDSHSDN